MEPTDQDINYELLLTEINTFFSESILAGLKSEIAPYLDFQEFFVEKSKEFEINSAKNIKNQSLQGYLFENANYCNSLYKFLDERVHEKPDSDLIERMNNLGNEAFNLLEIIPESKDLAEKINNIFSPGKPRNKLIHFRDIAVTPLVNKLRELKDGKKEEELSINRFKYFPIRSFFFHFLVIDNFNKIHEKYVNIYEKILELLSFIWQLDIARQKEFGEVIDEKNLLDGSKHYTISKEDFDTITKLNNSIIASFDEVSDGLKSYAEQFINDIKAGKRIETDGKTKKIHIVREYKSTFNLYSKTRILWTNSAFLLSEDWKLELEVQSLKFLILQDYFEFSNLVTTKFSSPVKENLATIHTSVKELKSGIESLSEEKGDTFIDKVNSTRTDIKRTLLLKLVPALKEIIVNANIPKAVDKFETSSINEFAKISKARYIIKNTDYNRPIPRSEFETISPQDLLAFEMLPKYKAAFPDLKTKFIGHVQSFQNQVSEVPEIIDFAIDSSAAFFENEQNLEEALKISTEGIERADSKLEDLSELHLTFIKEGVENLKESVKGFILDISEITNSENAFQIKIRVARLKAIEQSKAVKEKVLLKIRNFIPVAIENIKNTFNFLRSFSQQISKQIIGEESVDFISSDTSDFLAETEEAINKLPYIYQRLFKIEPLSSFELYIDREKPIEQISLAYSKWKEGKFAPVIIVGEKGSGKTTFINRFLKKKAEKDKVLTLDLHIKNETPEAIYNGLLKEKVISSALDDENKSEKRSIVIIDGLERLFTSEINGFNYLLMVMQLISDTNSKIFWMVSCHIYSWYFIDKAYGVSDYFGYHVKLNELAADDLRKIIEKRHDISGYNLIFEAIPEKKNLVGFNKKVKEEDKQADLKDIYFNNLNAHNNGNISQAFLYWLRSTHDVKGDTIYIRQSAEMNSNFVQSISKDKMVTLRSILIQNGLTTEDHARMFRNNPELSRLRLDQLMDDGILVKIEERYFINPLIYSQIVNKFYRMNLLH